MLGLTVIQQLSIRWLTLSRQRLTLGIAGERLVWVDDIVTIVDTTSVVSQPWIHTTIVRSWD